jgi:hypothetical protein
LKALIIFFGGVVGEGGMLVTGYKVSGGVSCNDLLHSIVNNHVCLKIAKKVDFKFARNKEMLSM